MAHSWDATGRLERFWGRVGGRDRLAELTGIQPPTLSGYNTGRLKLGTRNAEKISAVLGVSLLDLGAPVEEVGSVERLALERLDDHDVLLAELVEGLAKMTRKVTLLQARVARLEDQPRQQPGEESGS